MPGSGGLCGDRQTTKRLPGVQAAEGASYCCARGQARGPRFSRALRRATR